MHRPGYGEDPGRTDGDYAERPAVRHIPDEYQRHDNGWGTGKHRRERQPLRRHDLRPEAGHRHRRAE